MYQGNRNMFSDMQVLSDIFIWFLRMNTLNISPTTEIWEPMRNEGLKWLSETNETR